MNSVPIHIAERIPTEQEYRSLRSSVGWVAPPREKCLAALTGSLFGVVAVTDGIVIGMARIVGDAEIYCTIVDVVVTERNCN